MVSAAMRFSLSGPERMYRLQVSSQWCEVVRPFMGANRRSKRKVNESGSPITRIDLSGIADPQLELQLAQHIYLFTTFILDIGHRYGHNPGAQPVHSLSPLCCGLA
jgi:hypothetical protein